MKNTGGTGSSPVARTKDSPKLIGKILMKNLLRRQKDYENITCDNGNKFTSLSSGREHYSE